MSKEEGLLRRKVEQEERAKLSGSGRTVNDDEGSIKTYSIIVRYKGNPESQLTYSTDEIESMIRSGITRSGGNRGVSQRMKIEFEREVRYGFVTMTEYFDSGFEIVEDESKIHKVYLETSKRIILAIRSFLEEGSWVTSNVMEFTVTTAPLLPEPEPDAEPATTFVSLPPEISHSKKGLINIKNRYDSKCLLWSHVRHLKSDTNPGRISETDREFAKTLDYSGISFPTPISQIKKVETQNDISINVFRYKDGKLTPAFITKLPNRKNMNLLLLGEHYVLIRNFSSLLFGLTGKKGSKFFCYPCVEGFTTIMLLRFHKRTCPHRKPDVVDDGIVVPIPVPGRSRPRSRRQSNLKVVLLDSDDEQK